MTKRQITISALATALLLSCGIALAADQEKATATKQEQVYGSQMMTQQERADYRTKMRAAKTAEDVDQVRKEHHDSMKDRAKERGVTLPDEPPVRGGGMGPGGGRGR